MLTGCNKLLDAGSPTNKVTTPQVYTSDSLAQAALIGIYYKIMEGFNVFNGFMSRYPGLSCDELSKTSVLVDDNPFLINTLTIDNNTVGTTWASSYFYIYQCNDAIIGLTGNHSITPALRDQLLGEAYFLRAFSYFYLVNLYGDVPLIATTDYTKNTNTPRTPVNEVYDQMIADLVEAQHLLTNTYAVTPDFPTARVRVNRLAAKALQARIYLYREQWAEADAAASEVIESGVYQLESLQQAFLYNSKEAILQFMPVTAGFNTAEGGYFVPIVPNGKPSITLSDSLLKYLEPDDLRQAWIRTVTVSGKQYRSPYKFKQNTATSPREEYNMVLRLAEQYCIRAEARARLNRLPEAVNDLNTIRKRAGLQDLPTISTQDQVLAAVEQECRIEFFAEWGHRWFDLKRWPARAIDGKKRIDEVMSSLRPDTWKPTAALWPIPGVERIRNPALTPNPGYE
ncbi:hypothetical protein A4H97_09345 [Niastella yeongjuensis]|uniref:Carbohydrate-binding protein SusD n=1 Tax=Niastella yeongjuensis TaxID=354355 RepID=A0A1V9EFK6_9BACT|nr:hypothetical protein A4H97_09345 [Niastella yeongjuensis]